VVIAYKIIGGIAITRNWECGTFDLLQESSPGNGWVEISRDCDAWPQRRWNLYPYASGNNGQGSIAPPAGNFTIKFRKYFPNTEDDTVSVLDMSDINAGILPSSPYTRMRVVIMGRVR
jgi:hypothetical protein